MLNFLGNKIDLEKNRHVSHEEAEEYARQVNAKHINTSAKLNRGIDEVFLTLTKRKSIYPFKQNSKLIKQRHLQDV